MNVMDEEEINKHLSDIANMSRFDMAKLWRFAPTGHVYFDRTLPLYEAFKKRFDELGGFSPEISKVLGWG